MINLLPEQYKKTFISEYHSRIIALCIGFLCLSAIVADALLVPTYISSMEENQKYLASTGVSSAAGAVATSSPAALHAQLVAETATLSQTLSILAAASSEGPAFTDIIPAILAEKPKGVSVTSVTYVQNDTLELVGTAATRDELAAFQTALQNQKAISAVNVPISDFASDTDIPFNMTITPS